MTNCGAPNCTNRSDADNGRNKTYHNRKGCLLQAKS